MISNYRLTESIAKKELAYQNYLDQIEKPEPDMPYLMEHVSTVNDDTRQRALLLAVHDKKPAVVKFLLGNQLKFHGTGILDSRETGVGKQAIVNMAADRNNTEILTMLLADSRFKELTHDRALKSAILRKNVEAVRLLIPCTPKTFYRRNFLLTISLREKGPEFYKAMGGHFLDRANLELKERKELERYALNNRLSSPESKTFLMGLPNYVQIGGKRRR